MLQRYLHRSLLALSLFVLAGERLPAAPKTDHPIVAGFERFSSGGKADSAQGGQLLLGELNCVSCHQTSDNAVWRKPAPILDEVAGRVRVSHLKKFLADPQAVKPGTTMPNLFAGDPDKAQKVEALVHFLASTGGHQAGTPRPPRESPRARTLTTRSAASPATAAAMRWAMRTQCCRPRCRWAT